MSAPTRPRSRSPLADLPLRADALRTLELVERAERMYAELLAAEGYATMPARWDAIAEYLGVRPETLERARIRAVAYRERLTQ